MLKLLMLSFFAILACMITLVAVRDIRAAAGQEVIHHDLSLTLHPEAQSLDAVDTLTVKSALHSGLRFTLSPSARIKSVSSRTASLPFTFSEGKLEITVPSRNREL